MSLSLQVMEDDEHYVDDPKNPQFHHHGGEYAYQGGNSGGDFEGEGFQGDQEGYEASGIYPLFKFVLLDMCAGQSLLDMNAAQIRSALQCAQRRQALYTTGSLLMFRPKITARHHRYHEE